MAGKGARTDAARATGAGGVPPRAQPPGDCGVIPQGLPTAFIMRTLNCGSKHPYQGTYAATLIASKVPTAIALRRSSAWDATWSTLVASGRPPTPGGGDGASGERVVRRYETDDVCRRSD